MSHILETIGGIGAITTAIIGTTLCIVGLVIPGSRPKRLVPDIIGSHYGPKDLDLPDCPEDDPALSLERLPPSEVREIEDVSAREQVTAHIPKVLERWL